MDNYVTAAAVRMLREKKGLTQAQLAEKLQVSDKTVSKWETGRGLPDITLLEPLAGALGVSVPELLSGNAVINRNPSANVLRSRFYVCPVCGNVLHATGEAMVSCCGVELPPLEAEEDTGAEVEIVEDEFYVHVNHPMERTHYISFLAYVTTDRVEILRLYPESNAEGRFFIRGSGKLYWYCNRHGLFCRSVRRGGIGAPERGAGSAERRA